VDNHYEGKMLQSIFILNILLLAQLNLEPTYFGLYMQRTDNVTNKKIHEILIIGSISDGRYSSIEDQGEYNESNLSLSNRANIIKTHNDYIAFNRGQSIGAFKIDNISLEDFDCSKLVIGKSFSMKPSQSIDHTAGLKGFSGGHDIDYSHSISIALESAVDRKCIQEYSLPLSKPVSEKDSLALHRFALGEIQKRNLSLRAINLQMSNIVSYNLQSMGKILYLFTCFAATDSSIESLAIIASMSSNGINAELLIANTNESDSWGHGHTFLDALDFDNDEIPEFVFQVGYYEATGFEIYKYKNGKFEKVFAIIPWGC
jgi:hypothetical protein